MVVKKGTGILWFMMQIERTVASAMFILENRSLTQVSDCYQATTTKIYLASCWQAESPFHSLRNR